MSTAKPLATSNHTRDAALATLRLAFAAEVARLDAALAEATALHDAELPGLRAELAALRDERDAAAEARAYLAHPLLGPRLRQCTDLVLRIEGRSAQEIFGSPDDLKFRSSMTLFGAVADDPAPFDAALQKYFSGRGDARTRDILFHGA